jgi:hypothetical protein
MSNTGFITEMKKQQENSFHIITAKSFFNNGVLTSTQELNGKD